MKLREPEILLSEIKTKKIAVSFTQAKRSQHFQRAITQHYWAQHLGRV